MTLENPGFVTAVGERGLLGRDELRELLGRDRDGYRLFRHLVDRGLLPRDQAVDLWVAGYDSTLIDLDMSFIQPEVLQLLPREVAEQRRMIFVYRMGGMVTVAMAAPNDREALREAKRHAGGEVSVVCALPDEVARAIDLHYPSFADLDALKREAGLSMRLQAGTKELTREELERLSGEKAVVKFFDVLLLLALQEEASDIHLEPFETFVQIRFRIDGVLAERSRISREMYPALLGRLKAVAKLDIIEHRRPQDGRITLPVGDRNAEFRVSLVPALFGEKAVLRLLSHVKRREIPRLEDLFLSRRIYAHIRQVITSPSGVFFITGPTGSGKTTALFSALQYINRPGINVMTVEDPVEYHLPGVTQVQVNPRIGVDFTTVLRAFLRQDPDVILIGEIRDLETARIATQAALTGHLVLSTLHSNDAVQAVTRLVEIGVEPFLVGPSIIGVLSQRLVRRICDQCSEPYDPGREALDRLFVWNGEREVKFYRGKGCPHCKYSGYRGRIAIHEVVMVDEEIRRLVIAGASGEQIRQAAIGAGYRSMRYDGIKKVLRGLTTLEEVERAVPNF